VKHPVLWATLLYLTLDLSLAIMPGAFVFEPAESVESVQTSRGRTASESIAVPPPAPGHAFAVPEMPRTDTDRWAASPSPQRRREHRPASRSSHSAGDRARPRPSEDPH
jgi:hypothetical protein